MTNKFRVIPDGNLYRWQREYGCTRWSSRSAWLSDIEAATAAYQVASTYPNAEIELSQPLAQAVEVWRTVEQYAAKVQLAN